MLVEKKLSEALQDYLKGRKVLVLWIDEQGAMDLSVLSELLEDNNNHFLVDVPAYENPEFKAAVDNMVTDGTALSGNLIGVGNNQQDTEPQETVEPTNDKNFVGGGTKQKECP